MTLVEGAGWTLVRDGDAALVVAFAARIDPAIGARAAAVAATLRAAGLPAVRDVVEAFATVTVHVDPVAADLDLLAREVAGVVTRMPVVEGAVGGRETTVPVCYGGPHGPDLPEVARFAACSPSEAIRRHCAPTYRVYMLGFLPGFAYLATVDARIAMPRRATPRVRVPAGSVGIAGEQTGVYPLDSPGGWRLIGRTPLAVFDPSRDDPFLLRPGDRVRFEPIDPADYDRRVVLRGAGGDRP